MAQEEKNIDYTPDESKNPQVAKQLGGADEADEMRKKLEALEKEKEEYLNGWRRAKADLINYKNDELKRLEEVVKFGTEDFIRDVIAVLDSFDLALISLEKGGQVDKGIYLIRGQLEDVLKRRGIERITVSMGQKFDPALHESIGEMEAEGVESGMVAVEVERGYLIHGRVLRPARVKLAK